MLQGFLLEYKFELDLFHILTLIEHCSEQSNFFVSYTWSYTDIKTYIEKILI